MFVSIYTCKMFVSIYTCKMFVSIYTCKMFVSTPLNYIRTHKSKKKTNTGLGPCRPLL